MSDEDSASGRKYLSARDAAELLGVSEQVLRRASVRGEVPGVKIGRDWRYLESDLLGLTRKPQAKPPTE